MSDHEAEVSRRSMLQALGASMALGGAGADVLSAQQAVHVHQAVAADRTRGDYKPKCFTAHEYSTLRRLAELIMPADEHSKSALDAGAPEFLDLLCASNAELSTIYTGGIGWLDNQMKQRYQASFLDGRPEQQTAMLDLIAYRHNEADHPELAPGIRFFAWARNMVVDAYYTSQAGIDDLGFQGNGAVAQFSVPEEAIRYAISRSPDPRA
jgi:hypothetical protein